MDRERWDRLQAVARKRTELDGERHAVIGTESPAGGTWWCVVPTARRQQAKRDAAYTADVLRKHKK